MKKGDFVKLSFEGKIKETGQIFDSVKDIGIVLGGGYILEGLETEILKMSVGEKRKVELPPEKAFGERKQSEIRLISESEFKRHGTKPKPGMVIEADNRRGRVLSVSAGRVTVDFNHPLAGKTVIYNVEIKELVKGDIEKVKLLVNYFTKINKEKIKVEEDAELVEIILPPVLHPAYKNRIAREIQKYTKFKKVKFSELFE